MASDWRGWRRIGVNEQRFRWAIVANPDYMTNRLVVRVEDRPSLRLNVRRPPVGEPNFVRACIEEAQRRGWPESCAKMHLSIDLCLHGSAPANALPGHGVAPVVRQLAEAVFQQERSAVGPLHDALIEAGLTELAVHFRDPGEWHPKGCWAVDVLTGRS